jgi:dephospho-CoA kinase
VIVIGLTGSIAAGKSEVARMLAARGARVVDADVVAHETYLPGQSGHAALVAAFGESVLAADGTVDRRRLGEIVFGHPERLQRLSSIVWPLTRQRVEELAALAAAEGVDVFVLEAPLLIEAGWRDLVDQVWFVRASRPVALQRLEGRGLSAAEAEARVAARTAISEAEKAADLIIDNDGDLAMLEARVEAAWLTLRSESR